LERRVRLEAIEVFAFNLFEPTGFRGDETNEFPRRQNS